MYAKMKVFCFQFCREAACGGGYFASYILNNLRIFNISSSKSTAQTNMCMHFGRNLLISILLQTCYEHVNVSFLMKSCQQTSCKLIVKTCYPQACCKLFEQVVTSLQITSGNKPDFNRLAES